MKGRTGVAELVALHEEFVSAKTGAPRGLPTTGRARQP